MSVQITITNEWQSLSSLSGFPVGTQVKLQNKGNVFATMIESATQPAADFKEGEYITSVREAEPSKVIPTGSGEIWLRVTNGLYRTELFVQEV